MLSHPFQLVLLASFLIAVIGVLGVQIPTSHRLKKRGFYGRGTWYDAGEGNCGEYDSDQDHIVAVSEARYNGGAHCNQYITIRDTQNRRQTRAMVHDSCPGCGTNDLDMAKGLFAYFDNPSRGEIPIEWWFD
ncbi:hypothetical protein JAAARDRAFT_224135 [Jaapia argillacea MUCL 33604]|uniref:RlpA-like protein double-psi beta-barrel domain-containing protein n=1 Tax=Jaapia argillacea MUCL 33604 TaxID=933084 RepID=A0A067QDZ0_9AGAM|nr:hypothetical protein JAAARDRAFT_224135 [Jaapia argillacea MUCL 33604]